MIISVHIPRTAGSSFRAYLRSNPKISLQEDYGNPIMVPSLVRNSFAILGRMKLSVKPVAKQIDCLHGHFLPVKYKGYLGAKNVEFITWLRDPALRIRSQYDYCFQSNKAIDKSPFQNKVAREKWSFEAFYSDPRMQNLYSKFFWQFPLSNFDFVGIVEHYEEDFKIFCQRFFQDFNPKFTYGNRTLSFSVDDDSLEQIRRINKKDYAIYDKGLALRAKRMEDYELASKKHGGNPA